MRAYSTTRVVLLALIIAVAAASIASAQTEPVRCAGCKTEHFLIEHLKAPYAEASGAKLLPGGTGNKKAITLLAEGQLAFAYTCKPHQKLAQKFGLDAAVTGTWVSTAIARDPIVVVANPACGVSNLSSDQLKALFTGQVANWSAVGGADLPVTVAYLDESVESGVVTVFKEVTVGDDQPLDAGAKKLASPSQLGHFVKSEAGAVTFMALNSYEDGFGTVVAVDGVAAEKANIVDGVYPLCVTYYVVHDRSAGAEADEFLAYLATGAGMGLIDEIMVALPRTAAPLP